MDEIIKLEEELRLAMISGDVKKLDKLIDNSLIFTAPNGAVATKQMDLESYKNKIQKISELTPSEQIIKIYKNVATVSVKMKLKGTYSNTEISGDYRYLRIWTKIDGSWKIIAGSVLPIRE